MLTALRVLVTAPQRERLVARSLPRRGGRAAASPPRRGANRWTTLLVVLVVAAAGCSSSTFGNSRDEEPTDIAGEVDSLEGLTLPLESLLVLGADAKSVLDAAVDTLADRCMSELGFDYIPYPPSPPRSFLSVKVRYGYLSPEDASVTGYATTYLPPEDAGYVEQVAAVDARRQAFGPSYERALYGSGDSSPRDSGDTGGCYPTAQETVYGVRGGTYSWPAHQALLELQSQSGDELYASRAARDVIARWSDCMSDAGYTYREWWEAREPFGQSDTASQAERRQAMTDAECRATVSLERTLFDLEAGIMERLIERNPDLVRDYRAQLEESLDEARDLIGQG